MTTPPNARQVSAALRRHGVRPGLTYHQMGGYFSRTGEAFDGVNVSGMRRDNLMRRDVASDRVYVTVVAQPRDPVTDAPRSAGEVRAVEAALTERVVEALAVAYGESVECVSRPGLVEVRACGFEGASDGGGGADVTASPAEGAAVSDEHNAALAGRGLDSPVRVLDGGIVTDGSRCVRVLRVPAGLVDAAPWLAPYVAVAGVAAYVAVVAATVGDVEFLADQVRSMVAVAVGERVDAVAEPVPVLVGEHGPALLGEAALFGQS